MNNIVAALLPSQVATGGNQNVLQNFLSQAIAALQPVVEKAKAIKKVAMDCINY